MLNEETELDATATRSPGQDSQKSEKSDDGLKETNLFVREMSLSEVVNTVLSTTTEETEEVVSTENEPIAEGDKTEKEEDTKEESENPQETNVKEKGETVTKTSRELKLLLELSKEANLDTNIGYKRKSVEHHHDHKYASTPGSDAKRSMRSQNPEFVVKHQKFLSKLSFDGDPGTPSDNNEEKSVKEKTQKKMKEFMSIGGAIDEKTRKLLKPVMALVQNNKDGFCWRCHREGINISCETCPRSYHLKCLKHTLINMVHWVCPECVAILNAENTKTRSPALKDMSLEQLCGLLKFALKRMAQCNDSEPFLRPVNEIEVPDYNKYIVQPMDLGLMQRNIRDNLYGSTNAFEADAKWLLHNSIIFNSYQSKLTTIAKSILKVCKQEMSEIENCPTCYLNANTTKDWFVEVCPKPHILLWAKLKGFPYWPAKAMCTNSQGMVDVRFFGAHDRAWVPFKECFLYSLKDPNAHKQMKNDIIECIKELDVHIENLKKVYGEFVYAPYRTPYDPENEVQQLQLLLPTYKPAYHTSLPRKFLKIDTLLKKRTDRQTDEKQASKTPADSVNSEKNQGDHKEMEGYGTDEDMETDDVDNHSEVRHRTISKRRARPASINSQCSNSDQSIKSDTSRLSSEKAHMDVDLSNDEANAKAADPTDSPEAKKNHDDKQPHTRQKISDKLIKRLSETNSKDADSTEMDVSEIEGLLSEEVALSEEIEKSVIESEGRPSRNDINEVILGKSPDSVEVLGINPNCKSPIDAHNDEVSNKASNNDNNNSSVFTMSDEADGKEMRKRKSPSPGIPTVTAVIDDNKVSDTPNSDELLEEMYSEAVDASGLSKSEKEQREAQRDTPTQPKVSSNKRKRTEENEATQDEASQNKFIKLVDINTIKKDALKTAQQDAPLLKKRLATPEVKKATPPPPRKSLQAVKKATNETPVETVEIKSEPNSDAENEPEDFEAKKQYLSALNISEKVNVVPKPKESRVKTRTEVANTAKVVANTAKVVANSAKVVTKINEAKSKKADPLKISDERKNTLPRLIKQLPPNQRARKTFARSSNSSPQPPTTTKSTNDTPKVTKIVNPTPQAPPPKTVPLESQTNNSNVVILAQPPPQSVVNTLTVLPSNQTIAYTANMGNQIFTMVQPSAFGNFIVPTTGLNPVPPLNPISDKPTSNAAVSQNDATLAINSLIASASAIFTNSTNSNGTASTITSTTSTAGAPILSVSTAATTNTSNVNTITILNGQTTIPLIGGKPSTSDVTEDYSYMSGYIPEHISKSISELMHRAPPKLKPRPPGPLSNAFDPGMPSTAGRVTSVINSVAHKLSDYFRGMLVETLNDLGTSENAEAVITTLRLENERLRQKHADDILEIKKNVNAILRDIQKSIIDERERVIEETKTLCDLEAIRRIEEAKSKQWCANCMKEAQFYCCWNTSYCDYPCQMKHWPKHISKCTQSSGGGQADGKMVTPVILRKTAPPPKSFATKQLVTKTSKELLNTSSPNRCLNKAVPTPPLKTSHVTAVTVMEPPKRTYDAKPIISIPASVAHHLNSKVLHFNKIKLSTPTSTTSNTSSAALTPQSQQQKFVITSTKQMAPPTIDLDDLE